MVQELQARLSNAPDMPLHCVGRQSVLVQPAAQRSYLSVFVCRCEYATLPGLDALRSLTALTDFELVGHPSRAFGETSRHYLTGGMLGFLSQLTSLNSLSIVDFEFGIGAEEAVGSALRKLRGLSHLELNVGSGPPNNFGLIGRPLGKLSGLTHLSLVELVRGNADTAALMPALRKLTRLTYLDLSTSQLGVGAGAQLGRVLKSLSELTNLRLYMTSGLEDGFVSFAPALGRLRRLRKVDLEYALTRKEIDVLVKELKKMPSLCKVRVGYDHRQYLETALERSTVEVS